MIRVALTTVVLVLLAFSNRIAGGCQPNDGLGLRQTSIESQADEAHEVDAPISPELIRTCERLRDRGVLSSAGE